MGKRTDSESMTYVLPLGPWEGCRQSPQGLSPSRSRVVCSPRMTPGRRNRRSNPTPGRRRSEEGPPASDRRVGVGVRETFDPTSLPALPDHPSCVSPSTPPSFLQGSRVLKDHGYLQEVPTSQPVSSTSLFQGSSRRRGYPGGTPFLSTPEPTLYFGPLSAFDVVPYLKSHGDVVVFRGPSSPFPRVLYSVWASHPALRRQCPSGYLCRIPWEPLDPGSTVGFLTTKGLRVAFQTFYVYLCTE